MSRHTSISWSRDKQKNVISSLSQVPWAPNLAGWWFRMRGPTHKISWHIIHVDRWKMKNVITPHSQGPWSPKFGRVLAQDVEAPPEKVMWYFDPVVTGQFQNVIFSQPQGLWPLNIAGWVLRLRGRDAQRQMTLLFRGHITKTLYLYFQMVYGLWHWLRTKGYHLKIWNSRDISTTLQSENVMPNFY